MHTPDSTIHSLEHLPFFSQVIHSKLMEAKHYLALLQTYTPQSLPTKRYRVQQIMDIHDENNEFILRMQHNGRAWSQCALTRTQKEHLTLFSKQLQQLETTIYHTLYLIEQLEKPKKPEEHALKSC